MELQELIEVVSDVAASLELPMDLEATLDRITKSAAEAIPGIDHVSISVTTKGGRIQTLAPTDLFGAVRDQRRPRAAVGHVPGLVAALPTLG